MILLSYQFLISIHALREEGDTKAACLLHNGFYFYPRPPRGGRPRRRRSPRPAARISIHALREEGDPLPGNGSRDKRISIHALREEGDALCVLALQHRVGFLSTPSARRATFSFSPCFWLIGFLSTPSARRATVGDPHRLYRAGISIHALREEGDQRRCQFQPSCRSISIHALREEGDAVVVIQHLTTNNFYPRPPRGGRQMSNFQRIFAQLFLSTPSARRATNAISHLPAIFIFLSTPSARRATNSNLIVERVA